MVDEGVELLLKMIGLIVMSPLRLAENIEFMGERVMASYRRESIVATKDF